MVSFNSTINPWRDRLTKINNGTTLTQLQQWIEGLSANGSTNTLAALRFALADPDTEAMYLLTDGRPDQVMDDLVKRLSKRKISSRMNDIFSLKFNIVKQFLFIQLHLIVKMQQQINFSLIFLNRQVVVFMHLIMDLRHGHRLNYLK